MVGVGIGAVAGGEGGTGGSSTIGKEVSFGTVAIDGGVTMGSRME
jgi:hypothetical protein